jgi:hypothetical protein
MKRNILSLICANLRHLRIDSHVSGAPFLETWQRMPAPD